MNEVTVAWTDEPLMEASVLAIRGAFEELYVSRFGAGTTRPEMPVEIITFRLDAVQVSLKPAARQWTDEGAPPPVPRGSRDVYVRNRGLVPTQIYAFATLRPGDAVHGPAIVERPDTTVYVPDGYVVRLDVYRNLRMQASNE